MRVTECAQRAVLHARVEAGRLGHDRVGTEHLLLALLRDQGCLASATLGERGVEVEAVRRRVEETAGPGPVEAGPGGRDELAGHRLPTTKPFTLVLGLAREGDGVAARVLEDLGAGLLQLREAVISLYSAGVDPEPPPPDRGPPPWEPPAGARLRRVVPLASEHPLPSGDLLVLLSLEIWSDWFDLRYPAFGMVRVRHHSFVPAPPPGTEVLELRFGPPSAVVPGEAPPLVVSTVVL